jgi:hypothetical protein
MVMSYFLLNVAFADDSCRSYVEHNNNKICLMLEGQDNIPAKVEETLPEVAGQQSIQQLIELDDNLQGSEIDIEIIEDSTNLSLQSKE